MNMNYKIIAVIVILLLIICVFACDNKKFSDRENNMFLVMLILIGIIIFLLIKDKNIVERFSAPLNYILEKPTFNIPKEHNLLKNVIIPSPIGVDYKLTEDLTSDNLPSIDGDPNSPKHMFMLSHNKSSPGCCPSTFSTSTGCICMTENQKKMFKK